MYECEVYFYKEGIKGLAFKGISYITDFSEASVPLIIGLSITRPNQKAEWGRGTWGSRGRRAGVAVGNLHWRDTALGFP